MEKKLTAPLNAKDLSALKTGDRVLISGTIYTARDAAHKRMSLSFNPRLKPRLGTDTSVSGLPLNLKDQIIYYCGPTPAMPGRPIGSAGPTTASRMDPFTEMTLKAGLKGIIGKGKRSDEVRKLFKKYKAVYFVATGGAGALLAKHIKAARVAAYPDLGPEAIYELKVVDFPVIVAIDTKGKDIFERTLK